MSNCKELQFKLSNDKELKVHIKEVYETQYSNYVWPSALVLCDFICKNHEQFQSKTVIELGSGTGICAIVAAKIGAKCYLTDKVGYQELSKENLHLNRIEDAEVFPLEWGSMIDSFPKIDYIIGSDCFYDETDFENLLFTVSLLLDNSIDPKEAKFFTTYQLRSSTYSIECLARKWNLKCSLIPFSHTNVNNQVIELYEMKKESF